MRLTYSILLIGLFALAASAMAQDKKIFPYDYQVRVLANDLQVVVVPTDFPNIVSLYIPVAVGSRNEVEPGKSGFAHFFEHMMFRGTENVTEEEYQQILQATGADQNAYTTDDRTVYHLTFSAEDLETVLKLEADRFQNLSYPESVFRTEALAVLGEYNKNSANPVSKLFEVQRAAAFREHTYRHTTMGFLKDIVVMPDQMEYSRVFFDRFYRPEYTSVIVVGDVDPEAVFAMVEEHWGGWARGSYVADIPVEPEPEGAIYDHVTWESHTLPWVTVAFRIPAAFGNDDLDVRALDVLGTYAFGSASDLYRRLVVDEQKVDALFASTPERVDPHLMTIGARVKDPADMAYVRSAIQEAIADVRQNGVDARRLDTIKSNLRYRFAHSLDNSPAIAGALANFLANTRNVETINEVYARYDALTPQDIRAAANRYLTDDRMVVVTLAHGDVPGAAAHAGSVDEYVTGLRPEMDDDPIAIETGPLLSPIDITFPAIVNESSSPLIDFRFLFLTGAGDDPAGKEGLAQLTAMMVADAGSRSMRYSEIQQALFPMAAGFSGQVDKEMTVFSGRAHVDNVATYYSIISGQLLDPGFRDEDFQRVRSNIVNYIRVGLRANNDEELGKEILYEMLYARHPYGHLTPGHAEAVEALTLDDVRDFYRTHYTRANVVLGLTGDLPAGFAERVKSDLAAALPVGQRIRPVMKPPARMPGGIEITLVQKDTRATAISMGFPTDVTRSHPDFVALWLVASYFGEHRSSNSYLFQRMRGLRGMNYGSYAYSEYFPRGMFQFYPDTNLGRHSQIFQIWIRPVPVEQAHFAIRLAKYELDQLVMEGLSEEDFEATRNYLSKFVNVLTQSQNRQLGYALDSWYYSTTEYTEFIRAGLASLTLDDVNRVIRQHLQTDNMAIVAIAPNTAELAAALVADTPSPITYNSPMSDEILVEDAIVQVYPLGIRSDDVRLIPVGDVFERRVFAE